MIWNDVFMTNIINVNGSIYRIVGKTVIGAMTGWRVVNVETGEVSIVRVNSHKWEFIG